MDAPARADISTILPALARGPLGLFAIDRGGRLFTLGKVERLARAYPAFDADSGGNIRAGIGGHPLGSWIERLLAGESTVTVLPAGDGFVEVRCQPWRDPAGRTIGTVGLALDVSERERGLATLRERELRWRTLVDQLSDAVTEHDATGNLVFSDSRNAHLRERLGRTAVDLVHPDDWAGLRSAFARTLRDDRPFDVEYRFAHPDGSRGWARTRGCPFRTATGERRVLAFRQHVTDLRRRREERERVERLCDRVAAVSRDLLAFGPGELPAGIEAVLARVGPMLDADAVALTVMPVEARRQQVTRLYWSGSGVTADPDLRLLPRWHWILDQLLAGRAVVVPDVAGLPPEAAEFAEASRAAGTRSLVVTGVIANGVLTGTLSLRWTRRARSFLPEEVDQIQLLSEMLVGARRRALVQDVAASQLATEQEIARLSRRLLPLRGDALAAALREALETAGRIGRGDLALVGVVEGTGSFRAEVWRAPGAPGRPIDRDLGPYRWGRERIARGERLVVPRVAELPDAARAERELFASAGVRSFVGIPLRHRDALVGYLEIDVFREEYSWSDEELVLLDLVAELLAGVLARLRVEAELEERRAQVRQVQKMEAVGRLAGGIAHEFNNLLTVIAGHAEEVRDGARTPAPARTSAGEIVAASQRAAALTRQLLTLSDQNRRIDAPVRLDGVVAGCVPLLRRSLGEDVALDLDLRAGDGAVRGDPSLVEQILLNLALNGRDAMGGRGVLRIGTRRESVDRDRAKSLGLSEDGPVVWLFVEDEGSGILPADEPRIFEPFFSTKEPGKGTGLGLSIVRQAVDTLGGVVEVRSEPGSGTRFSVCLAETDPADEPTPGRTAEARIAAPATILVAEDEASVRRLMRRILEAGGYRVLEAADGAEALQVARDAGVHVDALVSDCVMPRLGGPELAAALRGRDPELRVLFVSGYPESEAGRAPDRGLLPLLYKPFSREELLDAVHELFRG